MKKNILNLCFILISVIFYYGCSKDSTNDSDNTDNDINTIDNEALYQSAIEDAIVADSAEICDTLWAINANNQNLLWKTIGAEQYVLVGSFTKYPDSYTDSLLTNWWGEIWVYIPTQFKRRMAGSIIQEEDTLLRIRQLLGLPPSNTASNIVELWVKPADIFRPAADPEIDDNTAGLYFGNDVDSSYKAWFNECIYDNYFGNGAHYPWTRLGYTYDWSRNSKETGVSEFCIKPNSVLYVNKLYTAKKYISN